jgi:broad specificity phosphatase PhoE
MSVSFAEQEPMGYYFVRHGEPGDGQDPGLTELGEAQASDAARHLRGLGMTAADGYMLASTTRRTTQTADIIADALDIPPEHRYTSGLIRVGSDVNAAGIGDLDKFMNGARICFSRDRHRCCPCASSVLAAVS